MPNLARQVALVSESSKITPADLLKVSAALQKQAVRDLAPVWDVAATIDPFASLEDVPLGYWPIIIKDDIERSDADGIHVDHNGQPMALVTASDDIDEWSLTASHEALEMLVDPSGDRLIAGDSPSRDQGRVSFLVEVCDPSQAKAFAYSCNGVLVADFYTPHYFDPLLAPGVRYSFTGAITKPRDVLEGGYLSWFDPVSGDWWQQRWLVGDAQSSICNIGPQDRSAHGNLRAAIDRQAAQQTRSAIRQITKPGARGSVDLESIAAATRSRAQGWRERIAELSRRA